MNILLGILLKIADLSSKIPGASVYIKTPYIYECIIFYFGIYIIFNLKIFLKHIKTNKYFINVVSYIKKKKIVIIILIITFLTLCINILIPRSLRIYFVDVGQGDCTLIQTPANKNILVDGGGSEFSSFDVGESILLPYLLDRRITKIDYLMISHFDSDHSKGCVKIIEELTVSGIILPSQKEENEIYKQIVSIAKQKKIKLIYVKAGDVINIGDIKMKILHPQKELISENAINNNSIVCKLEYKSFSILFTGDIEEIAEEEILGKNINLKADILKVAHHGSKTSSTEGFVKAVSPKIALIGVGQNNNFGHPSIEVIQRLKRHNIKVFRTDKHGEISIVIDNNNMRLNRFLRE